MVNIMAHNDLQWLWWGNGSSQKLWRNEAKNEGKRSGKFPIKNFAGKI